ncbi:hypothetical protein A2899_03500 [Candidatus Amesbacteria bacterium RIFCSPLOWO2_01_FULL_49_25]|uniref:protein O-GlcNAc transferase n=1 Tax=Candidatus Amesbacteria bacterium RIFCSPHIGHO2_01_FULL_48_32b TaxID=1797253 RepID=A0A1F4YEE0_9BACT|nr:MAG: hypothetical protein A2876_02160 [Candidatus Amesbacteria bacterium RIFCSPHIGHO2_01_FULL_48_32b]OGD06935.1 MAG: hypothetical protein A2899_03500 [Candidatus Amesbacteria bacterium RIFCSPLOWO2_01_FULL_49_25]
MDDLYNQGLSCLHQGDWDKSLTLFSRHLKSNPSAHFVYNDIGVCHLKKNNFSQAVHYLQKAKITGLARVYYNLGLAYEGLRKINLATSAYTKAFQIDPHNASAYKNLGLLLSAYGRNSKAVGILKKGLINNPGNLHLLSILRHELDKACDWKSRKSDLAKLLELENLSPFLHLIFTDNPAQNKILAQKQSAVFSKKSTFNYSKRGKKIRLGYLSDGLKNFPTGHNIVGLLESHDKTKFIVHGYTWGTTDDSPWQKRSAAAFDTIRDINRASNFAAANQIHADKIDILIDLKGHSSGNRLEILAYRPAPIQISYLGYPGTTGAAFLDYVIADKITIPPAQKNHYTEKVIYLPHCYRPTDNQIASQLKKVSRAQVGLPSKGIVFASFNHTYKITPQIFTIWMKILKSVPGSILWQLQSSGLAASNLHKEAVKNGIDFRRIIFAPKLEKSSHLSRLQLADIALDTFPTNGHTTTVDCLLAGVPVITLIGRHFASRVSASVLAAANLPQLITRTLNEYEKLAVNFGLHPASLPQINKTAPIFNIREYTQNLEYALTKLS